MIHNKVVAKIFNNGMKNELSKTHNNTMGLIAILVLAF